MIELTINPNGTRRRVTIAEAIEIIQETTFVNGSSADQRRKRRYYQRHRDRLIKEQRERRAGW